MENVTFPDIFLKNACVDVNFCQNSIVVSWIISTFAAENNTDTRYTTLDDVFNTTLIKVTNQLSTNNQTTKDYGFEKSS